MSYSMLLDGLGLPDANVWTSIVQSEFIIQIRDHSSKE